MSKIENRKIRIAVVGCGRISKNHFGSIEQHSKDLELVGVCDTDPVALEQAVNMSKVTGYKDLKTMLQDADLDVVSLCTPSDLHAEQAIEAAQHGVHVIAEKPMATTWEAGLRMVEECDKAGVRLFVVKQNRQNATLQLLKKAVDQGRFGQIYMVSVNVFWTRPQSYYDQACWRRETWGGAALMNQASHYVDLFPWLIGPVDRVHCMSDTLAREIEGEDTAVMSLRWKSGALGSMSVTMLTYPKNFEGSITIFGEKGTVRIGGLAVNEIQQWEFAEKLPEDESIKEASYQTTSVYGFGHPLYYKNVIDVLRGEAEPATDGRSGLKTLELLIAAYRSAKEHKEIQLPFDLGDCHPAA